jgi:hypothetical protein
LTSWNAAETSSNTHDIPIMKNNLTHRSNLEQHRSVTKPEGFCPSRSPIFQNFALLFVDVGQFAPQDGYRACVIDDVEAQEQPHRGVEVDELSFGRCKFSISRDFTTARDLHLNQHLVSPKPGLMSCRIVWAMTSHISKRTGPPHPKR